MKNTIKILITAVLILSMTAIPVTAVDDEISIEQYMLELNGDVNGDGLIDNLDAALILKYDAGLLTEFKNKSPVGIPLEGERLTEITADFMKTHKNLTADDVTAIESYGVYGDCEVFWIEVEGQQDVGAEMYADIGGYLVEYHEYFRLHVYKDGEFCYLDIAYDQGLISSEDVLEVLKICSGIFPTKFYDPSHFSIMDLEVIIVNRFGDVNCDRVIDDLDAGIILKHDVGL